jgi:hypothetical protein
MVTTLAPTPSKAQVVRVLAVVAVGALFVARVLAAALALVPALREAETMHSPGRCHGQAQNEAISIADVFHRAIIRG